MGSKSSKSENESNNKKILNNERYLSPIVHINGESSQMVEEYSSKVDAMIEPVPQVIDQRVSTTKYSPKALDMRDPIPKVFTQMVSPTDHCLYVPEKTKPVPQVLCQNVSPINHSSEVPAKTQRVSQIINQKVSPVMRGKVIPALNQRVSQTNECSKIPEIRETEPQVFTQGVSSTDHSLKVPAKTEPVPQIINQTVSPVTVIPALKQRVFQTNECSKIPEIREPEPQVFTQVVSPTDHSSKVPAKTQPVAQVLIKKVLPIDRSSKVPAKTEPVPQIINQRVSQKYSSSKRRGPVPHVVNKRFSAINHSSRERESRTFNFNEMERVLPFNHNYNENYILSIILDWNTEWLTESSDSEEIASKQLSPFGVGTGIKTCYKSLEKYQSAYIPLILIETWAQIYNDFNDEEKPFDFKVMRAPDNKHKNRNKSKKFDNFRKLNLHTVVPENKIKDYPSMGDLLILEVTTDNGLSKKVFGYVTGLKWVEITPVTKLLPGLKVPQNCKDPHLFNYVVVVSKSMETLGIRENQVMNAKAFHYLRQTMRKIELLTNLKTSPLLNDILKPRQSVCKLVVTKNISKSISENFNESQSKAILGISEAVNSLYDVPKLIFIQGPPGTGKTFTLIESLKHIYMNWDLDKCLPHILICAPSNGAINEISRRVYKEREFLMEKHRRELRCVRVGNEDKIKGEDRIIWLDQMVKNILYEFKELKRNIENKIKEFEAKINKLDEKVVENLDLQNILMDELNKVKISKLQLKIGSMDELMERKREMAKIIKDLESRINKLYEEMKDMSPSKNINALTDTQKERNNLLDECRKIRAENQRLKIEKKFKIKMDIMSKADIVLSTLNSSHSSPIENLFWSNGKKTFDCVIIDEASQCSEPELLMPLIYKMSKIILIGDPKQLPATIISKTASSLNLGRSLFERFYNHFDLCEQNNPKEKSPVLMLTEQYRMHPQICQFPSSQFYGGKLVNSPTVENRNFNHLKHYILFDVIDTIEKTDQKSQNKKSKLNLKEANFVIRLATLIDQMLKGFVINHNKYSVGVITPYNGQKTHLINKFKNKRFNNIVVDVNTVDGFQGQERDVIIFSAVRAFSRNDKNKSIGFLDSVQRMNVALTRAKYSMILCISGRSLKIDENWKSLIDDSIRRKNTRFKLTSTSASNDIKKKLAPID